MIRWSKYIRLENNWYAASIVSIWSFISFVMGAEQNIQKIVWRSKIKPSLRRIHNIIKDTRRLTWYIDTSFLV